MDVKSIKRHQNAIFYLHSPPFFVQEQQIYYILSSQVAAKIYMRTFKTE